MRLDREKIETIMGHQMGKARWTAHAFCQERGISEPWLSSTLTMAELGHDFRLDRAERVAAMLGVSVSDIEATPVSAPAEV